MSDLGKTFGKLYDKYINKIYRFVYLKVGSEEAAEDLCSEVFTRGWEAYKNKQKIENPQAFLYKIARNLIADYYRKKVKVQSVSAQYLSVADPKPDPEQKAIFSSDIERVRSALSELKDDYQNVIVWRYLDNLSIAKIAMMLNRSKGATRTMLYRALADLREKIEKG